MGITSIKDKWTNMFFIVAYFVHVIIIFYDKKVATLDKGSTVLGMFQELPKFTVSKIRIKEGFNLFCYTLIFGTVIFQYLNNRFDWSNLILPLILLISILLPRLQLLKD